MPAFGARKGACCRMIVSYPGHKFLPTSVSVATTEGAPQQCRLNDEQYELPPKLISGKIENIDIAPGMTLTVSDFILRDELKMTSTYADLNVFQVSFCMQGGMEWTYIHEGTERTFHISAQQCQVRCGTIQACRCRIPCGRICQNVSISLDQTRFEEIFTCIHARGALCNTNASDPVRLYTYTPKIAKILSEMISCRLCEELKKIYLHGKIMELIAIYCDDVICNSPTNDFGIRISAEDYDALLKAREIISRNFAHPLTIQKLAKEAAINEQRLKEGFRCCFGTTVNGYIIETRMETAQKLLLTGFYTVNAVALMVGYSHAGYFINLFRKHYGLSPGELLKNNK